MTKHERLRQLRGLRARVDAEIGALERDIDAENRRVRNRPTPTSKVNSRRAVCGTDGGYYRHRRTLGEDACLLCLDAHAVAEQGRKSKKAQVA